MVAESVAASFEKTLCEEVRQPTDLAEERDLLRLLFWTNKGAREANEDAVAFPEDVRVHSTLLKNSVGEVWSQALGMRAATRKARLHRDALVSVVATEDRIREMVETTAGLAAKDPALAEAHELAQRYLSGGARPERLRRGLHPRRPGAGPLELEEMRKPRQGL